MQQSDYSAQQNQGLKEQIWLQKLVWLPAHIWFEEPGFRPARSLQSVYQVCRETGSVNKWRPPKETQLKCFTSSMSYAKSPVTQKPYTNICCILTDSIWFNYWYNSIIAFNVPRQTSSYNNSSRTTVGNIWMHKRNYSSSALLPLLDFAFILQG